MQPATPPMATARSPYLAPLIALSVLLVTLVAAITVTAAAKSGPGGTGTRTSPSANPVSGIDPCVVGSWRVTSHEERVAIDLVGTVTFAGSGARVRLGADGTGLIDYGSGTDFSGSTNGSTIGLRLTGTISFSYRAAEGTVSFRDLRSNGTATMSVNGAEVTSTELLGSDDPASYTCTADTLTERTDTYEVEMERSA